MQKNIVNYHFPGPSLPFSVYGGGRMKPVDGGQSAIVFGNGNDPTPLMKLFCDNNDASQCKWKVETIGI